MANPEFLSVFSSFSQLGFEFKEIFLFIVMLSVICIVIVMVQTSAIQFDVNKKSRCMRERKTGRDGTLYKVDARTKDNKTLYTILYDMNTFTRNVKCADTGSVKSTFDNVKYYDFTDKRIKTETQTCSYDKEYTPSDVSYYAGHLDLVRFMDYDDTYLFDMARANK